MPAATSSSTTRPRPAPPRWRGAIDSTSFAACGSAARESDTCSSPGHRRRPAPRRRPYGEKRGVRAIQCDGMRRSLRAVVVLVALALCACGSDTREWMKLDQTYTTAEFRRDLKECTIKGKLDDDCMKARGWVAVTPSCSRRRACP